MKKLIISCVTILNFVFSSVILSYSQETIVATKGHNITYDCEFDIGDIDIGNPEICKARKSGNRELLINAIKTGETNLILWSIDSSRRKDIKIIVKSIDERGSIITEKELRSILKNIEGISVRRVGETIIVEGEVFTNKSFEKVNKVLEKFKGVINLVELSPRMKKIVKQEIKNALVAENIMSVRVKVGKNNFILSGEVESQEIKQRAEIIARAFTPNIVNAIIVSHRVPIQEEKIIELTLNILEIEKHYLKDIGLYWNPVGSLSGQGTYVGGSKKKPSIGGTFTGTITGLLPKINKIEEEGKGIIHLQQSLIVKDGKSANYFAGSNIPIPVAQEGGTISIEYKDVGVSLKFTPTIYFGNKLNVVIEIDSNRIVGEGKGGAPILSNSRLKTDFNINSNNSIALGNIISLKELGSNSGSPSGESGLSLMQYNKGKRNKNENTEVIIFVTPKIVMDNVVPLNRPLDKMTDSLKIEELQILRNQYDSIY